MNNRLDAAYKSLTRVFEDTSVTVNEPNNGYICIDIFKCIRIRLECVSFSEKYGFQYDIYARCKGFAFTNYSPDRHTLEEFTQQLLLHYSEAVRLRE